jgi:asparagine N-glycosylation enzyme membrane subunit Stt3
MTPRFWRKKWFFAVVALIIVLVISGSLISLKFDFQRENDAVLEYFSHQPGKSDAFAKLEQLTPIGSVVLCWWDYGRAVREWSHREAIEAYPSKDISYSVGSSKTFLGNLKGQLFGTWGSSEKIHDLADIFMLPEEQALPILAKYNAKYALVFTPDDLQKFPWIAEIAGYNATEYVTHNKENDTYEPRARGAQVTLLCLLFDDVLHPHHFTKLYDNGKAKIYRVNYQ